MSETILIGSLIFIFIWVLSAIVINRIVQKKIKEVEFQEIYRMLVYYLIFDFIGELLD